ncbi:hypothetical protein SFUMM280S_09320 [Streptomyces fumanus]
MAWAHTSRACRCMGDGVVPTRRRSSISTTFGVGSQSMDEAIRRDTTAAVRLSASG